MAPDRSRLIIVGISVSSESPLNVPPIVLKGLKMAFRLIVTLLCLLVFSEVAGAQNASGPAAGTVIQDFELPNQDGEIQKLSQLLSKGPVALVVIRSAGWCAKCKEQLVDLQDELESIRKSGLQVVSLSLSLIHI